MAKVQGTLSHKRRPPEDYHPIDRELFGDKFIVTPEFVQFDAMLEHPIMDVILNRPTPEPCFFRDVVGMMAGCGALLERMGAAQRRVDDYLVYLRKKGTRPTKPLSLDQQRLTVLLNDHRCVIQIPESAAGQKLSAAWHAKYGDVDWKSVHERYLSIYGPFVPEYTEYGNGPWLTYWHFGLTEAAAVRKMIPRPRKGKKLRGGSTQQDDYEKASDAARHLRARMLKEYFNQHTYSKKALKEAGRLLRIGKKPRSKARKDCKK